MTAIASGDERGVDTIDAVRIGLLLVARAVVLPLRPLWVLLCAWVAIIDAALELDPPPAREPRPLSPPPCMPAARRLQDASLRRCEHRRRLHTFAVAGALLDPTPEAHPARLRIPPFLVGGPPAVTRDRELAARWALGAPRSWPGPDLVERRAAVRRDRDDARAARRARLR